MEILLHTLDSVDRLAIIGDLDSFSVNLLREHINRLYDAGRYNLVVDLTDVSFVDSAGLGQLVAALKLAIHNGGDLILVKPNESVKDLLRITKLDTIFRTYDSLDEAVIAFAK